MKLYGMLKSVVLTLIAVGGGSMLEAENVPAGAPVAPPAAQEKQNPGGGRMRGMRRNALIWRAFSQLNETERKKMQDLQRSNPEAFAAEMRKLAEQYEKKENAWREKMELLTEKYRKSTDKAERSKIKAEMMKMEKVRFDKRLGDLEKTIAATKQRVALMEQDLKKRKERSDAIVEARVEAILSGELPLSGAGPVRPPMMGAPRRGPGAPPMRRGMDMPPPHRRGPHR